MREMLVATIAVAAALALVGVIIFVSARRMRRTEKRAELVAHESEAQLSAIVESAMDAIITVDGGQRIVLFNRAAEQVFRCRREEALGGPSIASCRCAIAPRTAATSSASPRPGSPAGAWATPPR